MTAGIWLKNALGDERLRQAVTDASRRRLHAALGARVAAHASDEDLHFVTNALELQVFDLLESDDQIDALREMASEAFQVGRTLPLPIIPLDAGEWLVRLGTLAVLGDRSADFRRLLSECGLPNLPTEDADWGRRVWASILEVWLRLLRKLGWEDLDGVQKRVVELRGCAKIN